MQDSQTRTEGGRPRARGVRRLLAARDGATAIEFALVSLPFFGLLFAIIETGLIFFVGQMLDSSTSDVARLIRTGQAQQSGMTEQQMKDEICSGMANLVNCQSNLRIDVRTYTSFGSVSLASPLDGSGNFQAMQFDVGGASDIVVVRAFYTWPTFVTLLPTSSDLPSGDRLLASVSAFRNEPFPW